MLTIPNTVQYGTGEAELNISDIIVGERARKDMGDIAALAKSIEAHGLLHPIVVKPDNTLVAGERRIRAFQSLGIEDIPARVIDVADLLSAERDENNVRKDFTPSEAVAIARVIDDAMKEKNAARRSANAKRAGLIAAARRGDLKQVDVYNAGKSLTVDAGRAREAVAEAVGMSGPTYYRARKIVEAAEADPQHSDLVEEMDRTRKVSGVYAELERRNKGERSQRHAVLRRMSYPKPNREVERAVIALAGICDVVGQINVEQLDTTRTHQWSIELKKHSAAIAKFARSLA